MMRMPQLGRAVYVILGLAILVLVVTYGGMELWPRVEAYQKMRVLDQRWHDPSLTPVARARAAQMLAEFGPEAAPFLLAAAHDADSRVRGRAYLYLSGLDPVPEEAVVICLAALKDDREPRARASAAGSLGTVAYLDREHRADRRRVIIASLLEAGRDQSPIVRCAAVRAMIDANAVSVDASPWLEDSDRLVRLTAAEAILWLDPANKGRMIPMLQAMIVQANPARPADVNRPLSLLIRAEPSACRGLVPTFAVWLRHDDTSVRNHVVGWLMAMGRAARDAIPALEALLDHGRPADRSHVALAIIVIEPAACERAAASLFTMLRDAEIPPAERIRAFSPLNVMLHHTGVPGRVRDQVRQTLRAIPDEPGANPELVLRVRQFLDYQERAHVPAARFAAQHASFP